MKFIKVKAIRVTGDEAANRLPKERELYVNSNVIKTIELDYSISLMEDEFNVHDNFIKIGIADYKIELVNPDDLNSLMIQ